MANKYSPGCNCCSDGCLPCTDLYSQNWAGAACFGFLNTSFLLNSSQIAQTEDFIDACTAEFDGFSFALPTTPSTAEDGEKYYQWDSGQVTPAETVFFSENLQRFSYGPNVWEVEAEYIRLVIGALEVAEDNVPCEPKWHWILSLRGRALNDTSAATYDKEWIVAYGPSAASGIAPIVTPIHYADRTFPFASPNKHGVRTANPCSDPSGLFADPSGISLQNDARFQGNLGLAAASQDSFVINPFSEINIEVNTSSSSVVVPSCPVSI